MKLTHEIIAGFGEILGEVSSDALAVAVEKEIITPEQGGQIASLMGKSASRFLAAVVAGSGMEGAE